jgi:uncharacterized repeat protein (TIGR03803 family)
MKNGKMKNTNTLAQLSVTPRSTRKSATLLLLFCAAFCATTTIAASAQAFRTLANFNDTDGYGSAAALVQGVDGNLYGTTGSGGVQNSGVIFNVSPAGTLSLMQSFCTPISCALGTTPASPLVLTYSGALFGVAGGGGANFTGTVYRSTPKGAFRPLYNFCSQPDCADGGNPYGLVQGTDGNLYGTTWEGGAFDYGSVFKITPAGLLTTVYSFCALTNCADGQAPGAPPLQASNGNLYGTTYDGGANSQGTLFELTTGGALTTIYSFCSLTNCADGSHPSAKLVQASRGDFYGTTSGGGANGAGTIFKVASTGTVSTLYSFCSQPSCADGGSPSAELIQANDGNLYGTATTGGSNNVGTIFQITVNGAYIVLHSFDTTDGAYPEAALVQATNGTLYGTTGGGGAFPSVCKVSSGCGTVFSLSMGLAPFVKTLTPWSHVGWSVVIYGTDLSGATSVTFNGVSADFTVVSPTEIEATVPSGATSGKIQVVTPSGTLSTIGEFHVRS